LPNPILLTDVFLALNALTERLVPMATFTAEVEVLDPIGMHARPAGQIAKLVKESTLEVVILKDGEEPTKANSALRLMALKVKTGEKLTVSVEADDEAVANGLFVQIQDFLKG
jgi:phosphotransferase system HPr (HPr) family protein